MGGLAAQVRITKGCNVNRHAASAEKTSCYCAQEKIASTRDLREDSTEVLRKGDDPYRMVGFPGKSGLLANIDIDIRPPPPGRESVGKLTATFLKLISGKCAVLRWRQVYTEAINYNTVREKHNLPDRN